MLTYGYQRGWTLGFIGILLLTSVLGCNYSFLTHRYARIMSYAVLGLTFALIESPTTLTWFMFYLTIIALALTPHLAHTHDARIVAKMVSSYIFIGWLRLYRDCIMMQYIRKYKKKLHGNNNSSFIRYWVLPLGLSCIFIMLFAKANPIITHWMKNIHWDMLGEYLSFSRILNWFITACVFWAVLRPKLMPRKKSTVSKTVTSQGSGLTALLFNERSIFTSLILFNGLFFIQNMLDITFLWNDAVLPNNMSYAQYAHQGAYPLIATALLAAVFVLIALKPQSTTEQLPVIRRLVYLWVGQNIFLVLSSITRLMHYIEVYSLTYLRVVAFIWMGLVALGLVLIIARIHLQKSNIWLINMNSLSLYATLYLCCFINVGGYIADYNVKHSHSITGKGVWLDMYYLESEIGIDAIPALRWLEAYAEEHRLPEGTEILRKKLEKRLEYAMSDWRQWTFRNYRLMLENK
jgi:hypothetical protein